MNPITVLDGGMGQELLRRSGRAATPLWSADIMMNDPTLVRDLHKDFIDSGARVITLNTYSATPERLDRHNALSHLEALHEGAIAAAKQAIELAAVDNVRIAACLTPLVASYRPEVSQDFDDSLATYRRLVELQSSGSDLFLCETMASISDARAACVAALECGKPVWAALTVSDEHMGHLRSGELVIDAVHSLEAVGADAILLNCSQPESITACWPQLCQATVPFGAYANGFVTVAPLQPGGTVEYLEARQDLNPEHYAGCALGWAREGASIIGGCCEVGPAHMQAVRDGLLAEGLILSFD